VETECRKGIEMPDTFDAIVIGGGVIGASTAFHLKSLGCPRVLLVERGDICAGGTAKSCAIIRTHYTVPSNSVLALKSLEVFQNFSEVLGDPDADSGFVNSGYIILAADDDIAEHLLESVSTQSSAGVDTYEISPTEALELHPRLNVEDAKVLAYEPNSGYADPYLTTTGFISAGRKLGVEVRPNCTVTGLMMEGQRITGIETTQGPVHAKTVISAVGPWTGNIATWAGLSIPLEVSRHIVLTFRDANPYEATLPIVKDMTTANKMYFRPSSGGVALVGTGDHGEPVYNADQLDENVSDDFVLRQGGQMAHRMPSFTNAELVASWTGPYDITPDWNPVLGRVPEVDGLILAYGFSGHGFKLAPMIGKILAQTTLNETCDVDPHPYRLNRFAEGELLTGAYGVGSIS
tara:strand:+ start:1663 stop:2880 length:1218 start_codon:yes stop_codon:yes gene_type:complete